MEEVPQGGVESLSLEVFKGYLDVALGEHLGTWFQGDDGGARVTVGWMTFKVSFPP